MTPEVYAVELTAHDGAAATTFYFTTGEGFCSRPSDTPASAHFDPRVEEPGNFSQFLVNPLLAQAGGRQETGSVVLNNADGGLDALRGYGFDGRRVTIRAGTPGDAYPSAWTTVFVG